MFFIVYCSVFLSPTAKMVFLYEAEYLRLKGLFDGLPSSLPTSPPDSKLPPVIDFALMQSEGMYHALNKAFHRSFGEKDSGIKITERGEGLDKTLAVLNWCLVELTKSADASTAALVNLWITCLAQGAEAASVAFSSTAMDIDGKILNLCNNFPGPDSIPVAPGRPRRSHHPNRQIGLCEDASRANEAAKAKAKATIPPGSLGA